MQMLKWYVLPIDDVIQEFPLRTRSGQFIELFGLKLTYKDKKSTAVSRITK